MSTRQSRPLLSVAWRSRLACGLFLAATAALALPAGDVQPAQRRQAIIETGRGKPLVRAPKRPALREGAGPYTRHYSFSIVEFAARCLYLGEMLPEANAALAENAAHYQENPNDLNDRDSLHWHADALCRLLSAYGSRGVTAAGRIRPDTEKAVLETLWGFARRRMAMLDGKLQDQWDIVESENHHMQNIAALWHINALCREAPEFRDRQHADGGTPAAHFARWTEYLKEFCLERARKGLFVEVASDGYNAATIKGLYNVYDFAGDPELKRRAGMLLELFWALWAQEQLDGVLGGGKARKYQSGGDRRGESIIRQMAYCHFGIGPAPELECMLLAPLLTGWRPSEITCRLAADAQGRGRYEIRQRPPAAAEPGKDAGGQYRARFTVNAIQRYSWCTPAFIIGTLMHEAQPLDYWMRISSQNRWHGVIFAGHPDARIVPQVRANDDRTAINAQWSVQSRGTLICQKLKFGKNAAAMRVWFSQAGLAHRCSQGGWIFAEYPQAYAAVRAARGATTWEKAAGEPAGEWLCCADPFSPVILEVAEKRDFADAAAFRKAVTALPLEITGTTLNFRGLGGDTLAFHLDQKTPPAINGRPVDYMPPLAFDSPFVKSIWNSGVVNIAYEGRTLLLDFNGEEHANPQKK